MPQTPRATFSTPPPPLLDAPAHTVARPRNPHYRDLAVTVFQNMGKYGKWGEMGGKCVIFGELSGKMVIPPPPPKDGRWRFSVLMGHRGWVYWAIAGGKMRESREDLFLIAFPSPFSPILPISFPCFPHFPHISPISPFSLWNVVGVLCCRPCRGFLGLATGVRVQK